MKLTVLRGRAGALPCALLVAAMLPSCGSKKEAPPAAGTAATTPGPATVGADASGAGPAASNGGSPIAQLCARDAACGCPIADCDAFFAKTGLPDAVFECFAAQSCESLCAADSGAPGSTLYAACLAGSAGRAGGGEPSRGGSCRSDRDCGSDQACCDGRCYGIGTSLWQTHCMMPSGKF